MSAAEPLAGLEPPSTADLAAALGLLDELVGWFENHPDPGVQQRAVALLQAVDVVHRAGLTRLAACLHEAGGPARARALADPLARLLFELYDLLPDPVGFVPLDEIDVTPVARP